MLCVVLMRDRCHWDRWASAESTPPCPYPTRASSCRASCESPNTRTRTQQRTTQYLQTLITTQASKYINKYFYEKRKNHFKSRVYDWGSSSRIERVTPTHRCRATRSMRRRSQTPYWPPTTVWPVWATVRSPSFREWRRRRWTSSTLRPQRWTPPPCQRRYDCARTPHTDRRNQTWFVAQTTQYRNPNTTVDTACDKLPNPCIIVD